MTTRFSRPSLIALVVSLSALSGGVTQAAEEMDHSMHEGMDHSGHDMPADPEPDAAPEESEESVEDESTDQHDHHHHGATP